LLFQGPSLRLAVARTERELKHSFAMVSRGKAVCNDTPVESIPEEGVQTEKQLKHSIQGFSRWKAFYNESPVEFISEEGKAGRGITQRINEMFSVTPGRIFLLFVHQTERETDFIYCCTF
ncbi:hypothetical protein T06_5758, partial [Trichinella sp. T6]